MSPESESRVALYIRVSSQKQVDEGHSLADQRSKLEAYAARLSLEVVEMIVDEAESGGDIARPGFQRVLDLARGGEVDAIVATDIDRLARNLRDLLNVDHELAQAGIGLILVDDPIDTSSDHGRAMFQMKGTFAELERAMIRRRTRNGMAAARSKGVRLGRPPVGYTSEGGQLVPNEADPRLPLARRAWAMVQAGASLAQVAAELDREGVATPTGKGRWFPATVERLVRGPRAEAANA